MRNYEVVLVERVDIINMICDRCGKVIMPEDEIEWQEYFNINFMGGYGSVFGDGDEVSCDLCQYCLHELIGNFCSINGVKLNKF